MKVDEEIIRYFPATQLSEIPDDLSKPRQSLKVLSGEQRREQQERCAIMTAIWNAADSDTGRRAVLDEYIKRANAHLWHSGTQNCTNRLRRAQHAFFSRSTRPSSTNVPAAIDKQVFERLGRVERAILDIGESLAR